MKAPRDLREDWQVAQAQQCPCHGFDDLCACQNENAPWKYGLSPRPPEIDWKARAEAAEARLQSLGELAGEDHKRGCEGREYTCTCGHDEKIDSALRRASEAYRSVEKAKTDE